MTRPWTRS